MILAQDNTRLCLDCGRPDPDLFFFEGQAQIQPATGGKTSQDMDIAQFLPRGSILHNTGGAGVLAAAVYTGRDSKLILNQGALKYKASNTEKTLNKIYVIQAVSVVAISIVLGALGFAFMRRNRDDMPYLFEDLSGVEERPIVLILTFWLLLVRYLPLDVVMLSETGKVVYSKFMEWDARMMTADR